MYEACTDATSQAGKVYYNPELAREDLEASVMYAAILNLLKTDELTTQDV